MLDTGYFKSWKRGFLHRGVSTVTCMAIIGGGTMVLLGLAMKPESMPSASFTQGVSKVDCVTVWF